MIDKEPLVSVLMTAYNREKFIAEAIESVLNSSYSNFELIIVDDVSNDNTVNIAREYEKKDERITVHVNDINLGDYSNRNRAAEYAKGKYIKYLDSDDSIYPEGLKYSVEAMEQFPEAGMGLSMIDGSDDPPYILMQPEKVIRDHFFKQSLLSVGPTGMIIRRQFFEGLDKFDPSFRMASDNFFNVKAAMNAPVVLLKKKFFFYREHEGQELNNPKGYFVYGYLANMAVLGLPLPLTDHERFYLKKKFKKHHGRALLKTILRLDVHTFFEVKRKTSFKLSEILQSLL